MSDCDSDSDVEAPPTEEELRAEFDYMDTDGDGVISYKEWMDIMGDDERCDKFTKFAQISIFKILDKDNSGTITFEELKQMYADPTILNPDPTDDRYLRTIFNHYDKDGDGVLSPEELQKAFRLYGVKNKTFSSVDTDGDGKISYEEFKKLVASLA